MISKSLKAVPNLFKTTSIDLYIDLYRSPGYNLRAREADQKSKIGKIK